MHLLPFNSIKLGELSGLAGHKVCEFPEGGDNVAEHTAS